MLRIALFHSRDWLHPKAGAVEDYLHQVFRRIALQGHYVAWVAAGTGRPAQVADGIQRVGAGPPALYGITAGMLLSRLRTRPGGTPQFDVVVEAVTGKPLALGGVTDCPVVPVVFHLARRTQPSTDPPGPVIVPTEAARRDLARRGVPEAFLVRALFGVASQEITPVRAWDTPPHGVAVMARRQEALLHRALHEANKRVPMPPVQCLGGRQWWPRRTFRERIDRELCCQARFACLFEGAEREALAFAAAGVPVVCPATQEAAEYIVDGETGLLYPPGDIRALGERLAALWRDERARSALGRGARAWAESRDWDHTARRVLAVIENAAAER